jgi:endoglucanase
LGRRLAIDQLYLRWAAPTPLAIVRWDLQRGSIPMISWGGAPTSLIASGRYDAQIRARGLQLRALHGPVMLRWFAEMDGAVNRANADSPKSFVAAWRRIHNIFSRVGATNVYWVWCPTAFNFTTGYAQQFYPGTKFVDWIGADGYNWAPRRPGAHWKGFGQIFSGFYRWGISSRKPLLIGEFGVLEGAPGQKAAWFKQADRELRTQFPAIRAVVYFDSDHRNFNWRVTTSSTAFSAFRAFATDPYFRSRSAV